MDSESLFDVKEILSDSTENIKIISEDAQKYLISLHEHELQTRVTSGKARRIANKFLELLFKENKDIED